MLDIAKMNGEMIILMRYKTHAHTYRMNDTHFYLTIKKLYLPLNWSIFTIFDNIWNKTEHLYMCFSLFELKISHIILIAKNLQLFSQFSSSSFSSSQSRKKQTRCPESLRTPLQQYINWSHFLRSFPLVYIECLCLYLFLFSFFCFFWNI